MSILYSAASVISLVMFRSRWSWRRGARKRLTHFQNKSRETGETARDIRNSDYAP
jgi:hypothetical protein